MKRTARRYAFWVTLALASVAAVTAASIGATAATTPACDRCHTAAVASARTAAHSNVSCESCHVPSGTGARLSFASRQVFGMTLRAVPVDDRTLTRVPDESCRKCHNTVEQGTVSSRGINFNHSTCAEGRQCVDCHSVTTHGTKGWVRAAEMADCLACHSTKRASEKCNLCHDERSEEKRLVSGSWSKTHGPTWRTTHGMGNLQTCSACHPKDYCTKCHSVALPHAKDYVLSHGGEAKQQRAKCLTCHDVKTCNSCHGEEMPHPRGFLKRHSAKVGRTGDAGCVRCHDREDCNECHVRHIHPISLSTLESAAR